MGTTRRSTPHILINKLISGRCVRVPASCRYLRACAAFTLSLHHRTAVGAVWYCFGSGKPYRTEWMTDCWRPPTLSEIAQHAGLSDPSHFMHAFKLATGFTPARFRAAARTARSLSIAQTKNGGQRNLRPSAFYWTTFIKLDRIQQPPRKFLVVSLMHCNQ